MGDNYLTENMIRWHKNDLTNRMYVPIKDGKKIAMPRYYKEKIYTMQEKKSIFLTMQAIAEQEDKAERIKLGESYEQVKLDIVLSETKKMYKNNKRKDL